jgi:hypothetical protein
MVTDLRWLRWRMVVMGECRDAIRKRERGASVEEVVEDKECIALIDGVCISG